MMIYGLALQKSRQLIVQRDIDDGWRTNVRVCDHKYGNRLDPEDDTHLRISTKIDHRLRNDDEHDQRSTKTIENWWRAPTASREDQQSNKVWNWHLP